MRKTFILLAMPLALALAVANQPQAHAENQRIALAADHAPPPPLKQVPDFVSTFTYARMTSAATTSTHYVTRFTSSDRSTAIAAIPAAGVFVNTTGNATIAHNGILDARSTFNYTMTTTAYAGKPLPMSRPFLANPLLA